MVMECKYCKKEFTGRIDKRFCSKLCSYRNYESWRKYLRRKPPPKPRKCKLCEKTIIPPKRHPYTNYCGQKCRCKAYSMSKGIGITRTKRCFACGKEFVTNYRNKIVCSPICRTRMWKMKNPDRKLWKEYKEKYPERLKESIKQWVLNNPKKKKAGRNRYYNKNKERIYSRNNLWRKNNRWYCNDYAKLERERKHKTIRKFTYKEWEEKLKSTNGVCKRCGTYVGIDNLERDHIYPIAQAYKDYLETGIKRIYTIEDIQPLCRRCNAIKGSEVEV